MVDKITNPVKPLDVIDKINEVIDDYVTIGTAQNITSTKTFIGEKRIKFKQSQIADKLGFTLYAKSNAELGALELRPNTIDSKPILTLNSSSISTTYVGFRYWSNGVNILAPQPASGNYFITIGVTDGTNTVTSDDKGTVNISTLLPAAQVNSDWNATSGVAQILNKPTIPTDTSDLTNGAGYITSAALTGYATESYVTTATANMQTTGNLVTSISSSSTNTQYPSAKCVYDIVGDIESAINMIRGV